MSAGREFPAPAQKETSVSRNLLTVSVSLVQAWILVGVMTAGVVAAPPVDQIIPSSAKGFVCVPSVDALDASWQRAQISQLLQDESMKPFVKDLEKQFNRRFETTGIRTGITLNDLRSVCSGEAALAFLEPNDEAQKYAVVAIAQINGREQQVDELMTRVDDNMAKRGATKQQKKIGDVPATIFNVPLKPGVKKSFDAVIIRREGLLIATDHLQIAKKLVDNLQNPGKDCLADVPAYIESMNRCEDEAGDLVPDVRWFVEPLGYAMVARELAIKKKRRSTDILKALQKQGFDAVQGIGGFLNFATEDYEILQRAYAYAPPSESAGESKYEKAAGMLACPATGDLTPQDWVPGTIGSYVTARWDIQAAYQFVGELVDEVAGEKGFYKDLIDSLENDPNGPRIDLEKEIVAHLGERVTILTDTKEPISVSSERFMIGIDLTNAKAMEASLKKMLAEDPDAQAIEYEDHIIWEILSQDEDFAMDVEGLGDFDDDIMDFGDESEAFADEEDPLLSNAAISVAKGMLVIASHVEFVKEIIDLPDVHQQALKNEPDNLTVLKALSEIGDADDSTNGRLFTRFDRELEVSYELIRSGRMPQSEGLIGRILNRFLGTDELDVREQQIDGQQMPEFAVVREYLGLGGMYVRTEEDGWYLGAIALKKEQGQDEELQGARRAITTAAAEDATIEN